MNKALFSLVLTSTFLGAMQPNVQVDQAALHKKILGQLFHPDIEVFCRIYPEDEKTGLLNRYISFLARRAAYYIRTGKPEKEFLPSLQAEGSISASDIIDITDPNFKGFCRPHYVVPFASWRHETIDPVIKQMMEAVYKFNFMRG